MKKSGGLFGFIMYLLICVVFSLTIYGCLISFEVIEVPDKYNIVKIIDEKLNGTLENSENTTAVEKAYVTIKSAFKGNKNDGDNTVPISTYESENEHVLAPNADTEDYTYYSQLDNNAKIIYSELEKNLENMKSGTYNVDFGDTFDDLLHEESGEQSLNNSFQLAINALNFDNPELFYIDISKIYLLTKITTKLWVTTYTVQIGSSQGQSYLSDSFANRDDVNLAITRIQNEKERMKYLANGSTENKIRTIHDYLIDNLEYDATVSRDNIYNIYGALVNKKTVCEGYARSFKSMMDEIGVPCIIACGIGVNSAGQSENHAWNYVKLDGQWYAIDVTWDDPVIIGNGKLNNELRYKYFLKGSNSFFDNHTEDGQIVSNSNFRYPTLSMSDY